MSAVGTRIPLLFFALLLFGSCPNIRGESYIDLIGGHGTVIIEGDTTGTDRLIGPMPPGFYRLDYLPVQVGTVWEPPLTSFTLHLVGDETLHVELDRMAALRLDTQPTGGEVFRGGTWVGRTPFCLTTLVGLPDTLTIKKAGYLTTVISPTPFINGERGMNTCHVKLLPVESKESQSGGAPLIGGSASATFLRYAALAATVSTISLGFWYKNRADSYFEDYLTRGDPDEIERLYDKSIELDDRARVFWIAGEIGALFTSYLFVKDLLFPHPDENLSILE